jgi:hypothetical protein
MRIPSGKTDQLIYFVAVDSTDLKTRETGLSSFTVYRSRNGGAATIYTTPTVAELSAANMPGVYSLAIDEDTTIGASSDSEEYCVHITQASMAPVTRTIELYRRDTTSGQTATVANGAIDADIERLQGSVIATPTVAGVLEVDVTHWIGTAAATPTVAGVPEVDVTHFNGTAGTFAAGRPEVNTSHWRGTAAAVPTVAGVPAVEVIDVSAAGQTDIRTAVGLATANLDTQLDALPTATENADALLDRANGIETGLTPRQSLRLVSSAVAAKLSGGGTATEIFRNAVADSKDRITATVDASGNRTAITYDVT